MLKKRSIHLIFFLSFLLTSCLNFTQVTTIRTDNTGEMFVHYWVHWKTQTDSLHLREQTLFNTDSIKSNFNCKANDINNIEVYNNDADSTIHGKVNFTFTDFDSLKFAPAFQNMNFSITNGKGKTKIFNQSLPPYLANIELKDSTVNIKYIYYLPGDIVSTNATSLSLNKLTWDLSSVNLSKFKNLHAVYIPFRLKETPPIIYYLTFLIIVIVLYYLLRKKRNNFN